MWAIVGIVFGGLLVLVSVMTTVGYALVRDRSERRELTYGQWYWDTRMIGKPISTRESRYVVTQAAFSLVMIALFGLMIGWAGPGRVAIFFVGLVVLGVIQVVVALKLRHTYIKADDARQQAHQHDYTGTHPQPVRLRLPQS